MIDCIIDKDDKVFPMVPAGAAIEEVFDQDLYFKRYEIMTRFLSKQYPDLEETFLDHLVEELYGKLFEENTK